MRTCRDGRGRSLLRQVPTAVVPSAALALISAFGCATVRRAREFQDPASAKPGERTPTAVELGLSPTGPIGLDDIVAKALEVHPTVVQARRNAEAAEARVRETEAALYPQVSTDASIGYRDAKRTSGSPPLQHRFESYGFDVSWLLFDFGRTRALARNLGDLWLAAQSDLKTAEIDQAFNVRSAYFNLSRQKGLLAVAEESVRQFQTHLDQVQGFVQVGTRIPYDQTKAEVDLGNARLTEVKARDAVLAAQSALANAVGLAEVVDWTPLDEAAPPEVTEDFDAAWALARDHSPLLAAARARELAAVALVDARIAALYPSLNLGFSYSGSGTTPPLPWSWLIGPAIQWVPFDGFQRLGSIDESVASLRTARSLRAQAEQQAWLDVRTAWIAIQDARQRLEVTALTVKSARQNVELAQGLFEVGKGTSVELADAQQALAQAQSDDVQAHADLLTARAQLAKAVGIAIEAKREDPVEK
jgi:outer membrane protein